jgi:hypothetical protein
MNVVQQSIEAGRKEELGRARMTGPMRARNRVASWEGLSVSVNGPKDGPMTCTTLAVARFLGQPSTAVPGQAVINGAFAAATREHSGLSNN